MPRRCAPTPLPRTQHGLPDAVSSPRRLEQVPLRPARAAELAQILADAAREGPRGLGHVFEIRHAVAEARFVRCLVREREVDVVEPKAADEEHEEHDDLQNSIKLCISSFSIAS